MSAAAPRPGDIHEAPPTVRSLYLVRHAPAFDHDPVAWPDDALRPLTPTGQKRFRKTARGVKRLVGAVDVVLSSPFVRAWQTAEILTEAARWPAATQCGALEVGGDPDEVVQALIERSGVSAIALVGHEPGLHELAAYLICGHRDTTLFELKKGGVACVSLATEPQPGTAVLRWLVTPKQLRAVGS